MYQKGAAIDGCLKGPTQGITVRYPHTRESNESYVRKELDKQCIGTVIHVSVGCRDGTDIVTLGVNGMSRQQTLLLAASGMSAFNEHVPKRMNS